MTRSLIVAREMPQHEFLFVGGGQVHSLRDEGYQVVDLPMAATYYRNNTVDISRTVENALKVLLGSKSVMDRLCGVVDDFDPHLIVTDYEYFTPLAARRLGRYCVSLDHQHIITLGRYPSPKEQRLSRFMTGQAIRRLYSSAHHYLIISFFQIPPVNSETTEIFPPVIRRQAAETTPTEGDHVLVYQTSPTFHRLFPVLESMESRFIIYGFGKLPERKNLLFKAPSTEGFLKDLASCRYAITNGGHNVVSEALYLGKPLFSFPIANAYEQFLNAHFIDRMGFGSYAVSIGSAGSRLLEFQDRLDQFKARIREEDFFGNDRVAARLEELIGCTS